MHITLSFFARTRTGSRVRRYIDQTHLLAFLPVCITAHKVHNLNTTCHSTDSSYRPLPRV